MSTRRVADGELTDADAPAFALPCDGARRSGPDSVADLLLTAADLVDRWRQQHDVVERCRAELERALAAEAETERAVQQALSNLTSTAGAGATPPPPPHVAPSARVRPGLTIQMLGVFQLWRDGRSIENLPGTRTPRILRYLAAQRGRPVPREILIDVFWPDADMETGRRNLHQSIYQIRCAGRTAGDTSPFIAFEHDSYALHIAAGCWCDVDDFEDLVAEGRSAEREERLDDAVDAYRRADALYSGDYLADSPYEEWAIAERERLRVAHRTMANRLADLLVQHDDRDGALVLTQRILTLDPSDEIAHRRAMRCYAATAERSQLVRQYEACTAALGELCGVPPSTATSSLFHSLMERCGSP